MPSCVIATKYWPGWPHTRNNPYNLKTLAEQRDGSLYTDRLAAALLTLFGLLALLLAAIGIYGVLSYTVTERTREIGIRLAFGARGGDLLKLVVGQGMALTIIGLVIGVGASYGLTRLMKNLLFEVRSERDRSANLRPDPAAAHRGIVAGVLDTGAAGDEG